MHVHVHVHVCMYTCIRIMIYYDVGAEKETVSAER